MCSHGKTWKLYEFHELAYKISQNLPWKIVEPIYHQVMLPRSRWEHSDIILTICCSIFCPPMIPAIKISSSICTRVICPLAFCPSININCLQVYFVTGYFTVEQADIIALHQLTMQQTYQVRHQTSRSVLHFISFRTLNGLSIQYARPQVNST